METRRLIWKVRTVKNYPEAHSHVIIGRVIEQSPVWLRIKGRTFHFGRAVNRLADIKAGPLGVRIIPWHQVEVINELPVSFDYANSELTMDRNSNVVLRDDSCECEIVTSYEKRL